MKLCRFHLNDRTSCAAAFSALSSVVVAADYDAGKTRDGKTALDGLDLTRKKNR